MHENQPENLGCWHRSAVESRRGIAAHRVQLLGNVHGRARCRETGRGHGMRSHDQVRRRRNEERDSKASVVVLVSWLSESLPRKEEI